MQDALKRVVKASLQVLKGPVPGSGQIGDVRAAIIYRRARYRSAAGETSIWTQCPLK